MAFDIPLFDKALPAKVANVTFHPRAVAVVGKAGEIVCRYDAEPTQVGECTDFGIAQRVFPVPSAIDCSRAVETAAGPSRTRSSVPFRLVMLSVPA